jgi:lambda family phage portal protein
VAYWIRSTYRGDVFGSIAVGNDRLERVPAADIIHLRIVDRWPQTRGVPWMHTVMRRLNDLDGYCEAEIVAARSSANVVGFIKSPEPPTSDGEASASAEMALEPGTINHLAPGEDFVGFDPSRPNTGLDGFMRAMLREIAAGIGVSYESISRDYSQSNYSSSRLSLLDDRDAWRVLQQWFVRAFRQPLHEQWLQAAVLARAIPRIDLVQYGMAPQKFEAATFRVRGWSWVDPTKEVNAYKEAVRAGFMTTGDVIAATSPHRDLEDTLREFQREHEMMESFGVSFDTAAPEPVVSTPAPSGEAADAADAADPEDTTDSADAAEPDAPAGRVVQLSRTA